MKSAIFACVVLALAAGALAQHQHGAQYNGQHVKFHTENLHLSHPEFFSFIATHGKSYNTPHEEIHRRGVFYNNLRTIAAWNAEAQGKGKDTVFNVTMFADLTQEEFKATYLTYKPIPNKAEPYMKPSVVGTPASVDWRNKGCITAVKNQAQCGSCWAFSATETVESFWALAGNGLVDLSPQQVTACTTGSDGCGGGYTSAAFNYIESAGLESASAYPYTAGNGNTGNCEYNANDVVAKISGWRYAAQNGDESALQANVATVGPLSICVDASSWQFYTGGVLSTNCGQQLDHCVQLVGYDRSASTPHYIIRNSWTAQWGINGYIYVEMNANDLCGVANDATYVTI